MPSPTYRQIHIDVALTNISVAYIQDEKDFIADRVFPIVPVQKQSDRYFIYKKGDWFRNQARERAAGTESAGGGYEIDNTPTYFAVKYAIHHDVTEDERTNADNPLRPDDDATLWVSRQLLIKREVVWAQRYFGTGIWAHEYTGVASAPGAGQVLQWDNANSTPLFDVARAQADIGEVTGFRPNVMVVGPRVYQALRNHPTILDRIKYTQRGIVTPDLLAALFDVEEFLVANAVVNNAPSGVADQISYIFGKHALLAYRPKSPGLRIPSAGYIFAWTGLEGAGAYGNRILRIPMPWLGQDTERIEGEMAFDIKTVSTDLGAFFANIVS